MNTPGELMFRKSSYSQNTNCVEVAIDANNVYVRDSKDRSKVLRFEHETWRTFVDDLRNGKLRL